jgi:hypothetical protein
MREPFFGSIDCTNFYAIAWHIITWHAYLSFFGPPRHYFLFPDLLLGSPHLLLELLPLLPGLLRGCVLFVIIEWRTKKMKTTEKRLGF